MFATYHETFKKRGHLYHQAMSMCPQARIEEFDHVVRMADVKDGGVVCDVPSGGGYLRNFLDPTATLIHIETSEVFADLCKANGADHVLLGTLENIPIANGAVDNVICLAALHHVDEKERFFSEAYRMLRSGGTLTIADVQAGSAVSKFLDGYVDRHNSMGHQGRYIHSKTLEELTQTGFMILKSSLTPFHWEFDSSHAMGRFCHLLFGIDKANHDAVVEGIQKHLGYEVENNLCRMNWELVFINAKKPHTETVSGDIRYQASRQ